MKDIQELWRHALEIMRPQLTDLSYSSWFVNLDPVTIEGDSFVIVTPNELNKSTLNNLYIPLISRAVSSVAGRELKILLIDEAQRETFAPRAEAPVIDCPGFRHNPKYTFDTFVVGESNMFAFTAAKAVATQPAKTYNPLFIYGGVGLGKTHLMHAIGHKILSDNPSLNVMYTTSETFTNELIQAIQDNKNNVQYRADFRNKYRNVDVLMMDDIQFIANKDTTQQEFFHTFNALKDSDKQIVITSDKHPREIPMLEERLRTRFEWGLLVDIQPPDFETRISILKRKAQVEGVDIDPNVFLFIADKAVTNIRELEGSLTRVITYANLMDKPVTLQLAERALKGVMPDMNKKRVTVDDIKRIVGDFYNVRPDEFDSQRRDAAIAEPRQIAMYLCRNILEMTYPEIGQSFGNRHHTTVIHACDKVAKDVSTNSELSRIIDDLTKRVRQQ